MSKLKQTAGQTEEQLNTTERLFRENETKTNKMASIALIVLACVVLLFSVLGLLKIFDMAFSWCCLILIVCGVVELILCAIVKQVGYANRSAKIIIISGVIFLSMVLYLLYPVATVFIIFGSVLLSIKYYDVKFVARVAIVTYLVYMAMALFNIYMGALPGPMLDLHAHQDVLQWKNISFPTLAMNTFIFLFEGVISCRIAEEGRKLVLKQAEISNKAAVMKNDIQIASAIQKKALPEETFVSSDKTMYVSAYQRPAKEVGGDFYDHFMINDHMLVMLTADVSDKGLPSAMFVIEAQSIIRFALSEAVRKDTGEIVEHIDLEKAVDAVNRQLSIHNMNGMFVTMWIACIDTRSGVGKYINAGHNLPYIRRKDGTIRTITNDPQLFLGCFGDVQYQSQPIGLLKGETLILYTDGVTDARDLDDRTFGNENLENAIINIRVPEGKPAAGYVCDGIIATVDEYIEGAEQYDDITVLTVSYEGEGARLVKEFTLHTGDENTTQLVDEIGAMLDEVNCPKHEKRNICVVIDEICSNISEYAYGKEGGIFTARAFVGSNYIAMRFMDRGVPFNPLTAEAPDLSGEPKIGGLGIHLVRNLMDVMNYSYDDGENTLAIYRIWNA